MSRITVITVIGGTGYAGSAIVAEAAARGHRIQSFASGFANPERDLCSGRRLRRVGTRRGVEGADVVVGALSPRRALADSFREVYRTIARLADTAKVPLFIVGGFSSLRPAPGAPRYVTDLSHAPAEYHAELTTVTALVADGITGSGSLNCEKVNPEKVNLTPFFPGPRFSRLPNK